MIDKPHRWDQKFTKRMVLIALEVHPNREKEVDEALDEALKPFENRLYDDKLIDDIEGAMVTALNELDRAGWIQPKT